MNRVLLDTNVFISGIFWSDPPYKILEAWQQGEFKLAISPDILDEYVRVGKLLAEKYKGIDISPIIDLIAIYGDMYAPAILPNPVSKDPNDDMFIACALGAKCKIIISGDSDLLEVSGYAGINIIKPKAFVDKYI